MMPETIHIFYSYTQTVSLSKKHLKYAFFIVPTCNSIGPYADSVWDGKKEKQSNLIKHFLCHEITQDIQYDVCIFGARYL